jgi:uncharacterized protein YxeA
MKKILILLIILLIPIMTISYFVFPEQQNDKVTELDDSNQYMKRLVEGDTRPAEYD